jgi:hypothetical protein
MIFQVTIYFREPIPELQNTKAEPVALISELVTKDKESEMVGQVNFWMQFGYMVKVNDQFGRKVSIRVSPNMIRTIKFHEPFEHELELQKSKVK